MGIHGGRHPTSGVVCYCLASCSNLFSYRFSPSSAHSLLCFCFEALPGLRAAVFALDIVAPPGRARDDPVGCRETAISPGVLWSRLGSGGTDGDCLFPSDLAMQQLRGGGGPFHLQSGIWHQISSWWWDAEWEQNKFIRKELLCPDNRPIGRRGKLCIYMQCGGLARLLSGLRALSWLDFSMTDSHQVQTQMGDIGILPREDRNSSWHSENCTGDGHFSETG